VELGQRDAAEGDDALVFLDITATHERRKTLSELVGRIARHINIPFTVGGGIRAVEDVKVLLEHGADKISVNSAAVRRPALIRELSSEFGSQCVVLAIDVKRSADGQWHVYLDGGRTATDRRCEEWAEEAVELGAGEILLTSMDHDGTKEGFAIEITGRLSKLMPVPVIASGGGGTPQHFCEVFKAGADAALAASIFHFREVAIPDLKAHLHGCGVPVRR
jgi:cyclase